jgi:hypothetical protein
MSNLEQISQRRRFSFGSVDFRAKYHSEVAFTVNISRIKVKRVLENRVVFCVNCFGYRMLQVDSSGNLTCSACDSASWTYSEDSVRNVPSDSSKIPNEFQHGQSEGRILDSCGHNEHPRTTEARHNRHLWIWCSLLLDLEGKDEKGKLQNQTGQC